MWFDGRANQFDDRAGLEPAVGRAIARSIWGLSGSANDGVILDLGAGTGAIGCHFAELPGWYVGIDLSRPMLHLFQRKLGSIPPMLLLVQADGGRPWPIRDHTTAVVFASRVVHLLDCRHVVGEVFRVGRRGSLVLLGRVERDAASLPSRLQRHKQRLLAEHGVHGRGGGQAIRQMLDACCVRGATALTPTTVARWTRCTTARQMIAAWEAKPWLTNSAPGDAWDAGLRGQVLEDLIECARREAGDLDRAEEYGEAYTLEGVRLP